MGRCEWMTSEPDIRMCGCRDKYVFETAGEQHVDDAITPVWGANEFLRWHGLSNHIFFRIGCLLGDCLPCIFAILRGLDVAINKVFSGKDFTEKRSIFYGTSCRFFNSAICSNISTKKSIKFTRSIEKNIPNTRKFDERRKLDERFSLELHYHQNPRFSKMILINSQNERLFQSPPIIPTTWMAKLLPATDLSSFNSG